MADGEQDGSSNVLSASEALVQMAEMAQQEDGDDGEAAEYEASTDSSEGESSDEYDSDDEIFDYKPKSRFSLLHKLKMEKTQLTTLNDKLVDRRQDAVTKGGKFGMNRGSIDAHFIEQEETRIKETQAYLSARSTIAVLFVAKMRIRLKRKKRIAAEEEARLAADPEAAAEAAVLKEKQEAEQRVKHEAQRLERAEGRRQEAEAKQKEQDEKQRQWDSLRKQQSDAMTGRQQRLEALLALEKLEEGELLADEEEILALQKSKLTAGSRQITPSADQHRSKQSALATKTEETRRKEIQLVPPTVVSSSPSLHPEQGVDILGQALDHTAKIESPAQLREEKWQVQKRSPPSSAQAQGQPQGQGQSEVSQEQPQEQRSKQEQQGEKERHKQPQPQKHREHGLEQEEFKEEKPPRQQKQQGGTDKPDAEEKSAWSAAQQIASAVCTVRADTTAAATDKGEALQQGDISRVNAPSVELGKGLQVLQTLRERNERQTVQKVDCYTEPEFTSAADQVQAMFQLRDEGNELLEAANANAVGIAFAAFAAAAKASAAAAESLSAFWQSTVAALTAAKEAADLAQRRALTEARNAMAEMMAAMETAKIAVEAKRVAQKASAAASAAVSSAIKAVATSFMTVQGLIMRYTKMKAALAAAARASTNATAVAQSRANKVLFDMAQQELHILQRQAKAKKKKDEKKGQLPALKDARPSPAANGGNIRSKIGDSITKARQELCELSSPAPKRGKVRSRNGRESSMKPQRRSSVSLYARIRPPPNKKSIAVLRGASEGFVQSGGTKFGSFAKGLYQVEPSRQLYRDYTA
jgi:hypothetical protein